MQQAQLASERPEWPAFHAIVDQPGLLPKRAHEAVMRIEGQILSNRWEAGHFLGTLPTLRNETGLGYRVVDEVIAILEYRGLVNVRRGIGGGIFVRKPTLEETTDKLLLHLALQGEPDPWILEARTIMRSLVTDQLLQKPVLVRGKLAKEADASLPVLARLTGNGAMIVIAEIADSLFLRRIKEGPHRAGWRDAHARLAAVLRQGDCAALRGILHELETMEHAMMEDLVTRAPSDLLVNSRGGHHKIVGGIIDALVRSVCERRSTSAGLRFESEDSIADRFGVNTEVVRPALRVLEDLGLLECQRGRRGAELRDRPQTGAIVRCLCSTLTVQGVSGEDINDLMTDLGPRAFALAALRDRSAAQRQFVLPAASVQDIIGLDAKFGSQMALENLLLELVGNPLLSALIRALALRYLFTGRFQEKGHFSATVRSALGEANMQSLWAIERCDPVAAVESARAKWELMRAC